MAESVKEVVPEARPRGQRRGLDRLSASGAGPKTQIDQETQDPQVGPDTQPAPVGSAERDAVPVAVPQVEAPIIEAQPAPIDEAPELQHPAEPVSPAPVRRGRQFRLMVAGITLLALLVGWLGYRLAHAHSVAQADKRQYQQLSATDTRNQAVLSAARQAAVTLLTYDYRHLDKDFAAVLDESTGGFKKDFASKSATAKTLFIQGKAIANGQVLDAAVASSTADSATVLAVLDQTVKNVSVPNGTVKHYRMQLKLTKVGSAWLVSDVEFPA